MIDSEFVDFCKVIVHRFFLITRKGINFLKGKRDLMLNTATVTVDMVKNLY